MLNRSEQQLIRKQAWINKKSSGFPNFWLLFEMHPVYLIPMSCMFNFSSNESHKTQNTQIRNWRKMRLLESISLYESNSSQAAVFLTFSQDRLGMYFNSLSVPAVVTSVVPAGLLLLAFRYSDPAVPISTTLTCDLMWELHLSCLWTIHWQPSLFFFLLTEIAHSLFFRFSRWWDSNIPPF